METNTKTGQWMAIGVGLGVALGVGLGLLRRRLCRAIQAKE
jgi:uncharacterized protein involved in exopolysaccharide biosynthesis